LLTRLSDRARSEGICRFTALVAEDNRAMAGLLRTMSASLTGRSPGTVEYEITLVPPGKSTTTPAPGLGISSNTVELWPRSAAGHWSLVNPALKRP
jgi:hypothetical protein